MIKGTYHYYVGSTDGDRGSGLVMGMCYFLLKICFIWWIIYQSQFSIPPQDKNIPPSPSILCVRGDWKWGRDWGFWIKCTFSFSVIWILSHLIFKFLAKKSSFCFFFWNFSSSTLLHRIKNQHKWRFWTDSLKWQLRPTYQWGP